MPPVPYGRTMYVFLAVPASNLECFRLFAPSTTRSSMMRVAEKHLQRRTGRAPLKKRMLPIPLFRAEVEVLCYPALVRLTSACAIPQPPCAPLPRALLCSCCRLFPSRELDSDLRSRHCSARPARRGRQIRPPLAEQCRQAPRSGERKRGRHTPPRPCVARVHCFGRKDRNFGDFFRFR